MRANESGVTDDPTRHVRELGLEFATALGRLIENGAGWHTHSLHHHVRAYLAALQPTQTAA